VTISADTFTFVADLVRRRSAIELIVGKEYLVECRLLPLVRLAGLDGVDEYVDTLRKVGHSAECDRVVEALTTNETSWFRDVAPFRALTGHVIPALVANRPALASVRVWSAACSTGQEPYSIAMALLDAVPDLDVTITATDISQEVLTRARAGRYSQLEMNRGLPALDMARYFTRAGTRWDLSEQVRSMVTFSQHNLLNVPPPGGPFDVIFLRNVLIYFDLETRVKVLRSVRGVLAPDGFLMMGGVESMVGVADAWERVPVGRGCVYRINRTEAA